MKLLLLDTETNGLPKHRFAPASQWASYPAILQLSWAIYEINDTGRALKTIAKRDIGVALHPSIPWDTGAAKIHGLTEVEARGGAPAAKALTELADALRTVDYVVAHNLAFDRPVIRAAGYAEADRDPAFISLRNLWPSTIKEFCTMSTTRDLLRLPMPSDPENLRGKFKAPKLNELYTWLYGHVYDMSGAVLHTAASDTHCLAQCVAGLLRRGLLGPDMKMILSAP